MMQAGQYEGNFSIYCHDEVKEMLETFCKMTLVPKLFQYIGDRILLIEVKDQEEVMIESIHMKMICFDIHSTKAKQFGFQGILADGQKITCLGDEPFHPSCENLVKGSDWLLSEAFCLYEQKEQFRPYEKHHSTALDAGRVAKQLEVKNLILYHTEDKTLSTRKQAYKKEAEKEFFGRIYVPDDLEHILLSQ